MAFESCGTAPRAPAAAEPPAPPTVVETAARSEGRAGVSGAGGPDDGSGGARSSASLPPSELVIGVGGSVVASGVMRVPRASPAPTYAGALALPARPDGTGWVCFSWIDHYVWGQDCYRTPADCEDALRLNPRGDPSPCEVRHTAYCLRARDASGEETRCFGELGFCQDHQEYLHWHEGAFSACARFD